MYVVPRKGGHRGYFLATAGGKHGRRFTATRQQHPPVSYTHLDVYKRQDYCRTIDARFILRGIRYVSDFEYEKTIADANRTLDKSIETIFLTGEPKYTSVASTIVRDILRNGGNAAPFIPEVVANSIKRK